MSSKHRKGRGRYHLREDTFLATCNSCHEKIHGQLGE